MNKATYGIGFDTASMGFDTASTAPVPYYQQGQILYFQPIVRQVARSGPALSPRAVAALNLIAARGAGVAPDPIRPLGRHVSARAPRRTVVARGRVSWFRAGTRRPL